MYFGLGHFIFKLLANGWFFQYLNSGLIILLPSLLYLTTNVSHFCSFPSRFLMDLLNLLCIDILDLLFSHIFNIFLVNTTSSHGFKCHQYTN